MTPHPRLTILALAVSMFLGCGPAEAQQFSLPSLFSDGAVLQRETSAPVWGAAPVGMEVTVRGSWSDRVSTAVTDANGEWHTTIDTPQAGGPHELVFAGDGGVIMTLRDVYVGEVWVCSGQSNMEWTIDMTRRGYADDPSYGKMLAELDLPTLRVFDVAKRAALTPQSVCEAHWQACTPETLGRFSAVATFFGRRLQRELDVPIGLITTNWGGTVAEAWTSEESLWTLPDFHAALEAQRLMSDTTESAKDIRHEQGKLWWRDVDAGDVGISEGWMSSELDDTAWSTIDVPGLWEDATLPGVDGLVWFRREVEIPDAWRDRNLFVCLGPLDDMDTVWVNGEQIGGMMIPGVWQTPRVYPVAADVWKLGRNVIAVRVADTGGAGGFSGEPDVLRITETPVTNDRPSVTLSGEWRVRASTPALPAWPALPFHQNSPTALFNGMIAPLLPYAIRGAIWYQGESNRLQAAQYRRLFPALIADWRKHWQRGDFPFYFVQIAPYSYGGDDGEAAELREAQAFTAETVPNTGMVVTMDVGNPDDIHPTNKLDVGHRLARWALRETYGRDDIIAASPVFVRSTREGNALRLHFTHAEGLKTSDGRRPTHFEVAGADGAYVKARATIDGTTIVLTSVNVDEPREARYAWGAADEPNVVNGEGLPASSFRTDAPRAR